MKLNTKRNILSGFSGKLSGNLKKNKNQGTSILSEFKLTGSWMSYSAPYPGREWDLTAHYFATGQLKFDPGFIYKKIPMSQAQEAFQLFKTPGLVKGKILLSNEEE